MNPGTTALTAMMAEAVTVCTDHVAAGGLPFVGLVAGPDGAPLSGFGVNRVAETGDPMAHAEVVAMRDALSRPGIGTLAGCVLLATGEPCGLCYRFAIDHGIDSVHVAVDRDQVARLGFDYRSSYAAFGITDAQRARLFHLLPVDHGIDPFTRFLHPPLPVRTTAQPGNVSKGNHS